MQKSRRQPHLSVTLYQRWSRGHKARGQGHKKIQGQGQPFRGQNLSRPRTQKNPRPRTAFPRTDTLEAKDRNDRGQGPRTQAQVLSKKKKRSLQKFFRRSPKTKTKKKGLHKIFSSDLHKKTFSKKFFKRSTKFLTIQKIVLSSSRGQVNFRGLEALRPRT